MQQHEADVAIIGTGTDGFHCARLLAAFMRAHPAIRVVACVAALTEYSAYKLAQIAPHAVVEERAGAIEELGQAIATVRQGLRYRSPTFSSMIARRMHNPSSFDKLLTRRQEEVLRCIAHSLTDVEVAAKLGLTRVTAKKASFQHHAKTEPSQFGAVGSLRPASRVRQPVIGTLTSAFLPDFPFGYWVSPAEIERARCDERVPYMTALMELPPIVIGGPRAAPLDGQSTQHRLCRYRSPAQRFDPPCAK